MARSFNGTSDYLNYSLAIRTTTPMTFACWAKWNTLGTNTMLMSIGDNAATTALLNRFRLNKNASDILQATAANTTTSGNSASGTIAATNTWYHCAAVFTSSTSRVGYLDGVVGTANTTSITPGSLDDTTIGASTFTGGSIGTYMDGQIAEAGIWSVALTADEITSLAKGMSPSMIRPASLIAYWPLTSRSNPEIELHNNYDMTVNGATAADHPRVYMPRFPHTNLGIRRNLKLVATDINDSASLQATVTAAARNATLNKAEGYTDSVSLQATVTALTSNATLVATDIKDSAALVVKVPINATLSGTDIKDSASLKTNVLISTILVATETVDFVNLKANVATNCRLNATDISDNAALNCSVLINFVLTATETQDSAILRMDTGAGVVGLEPLVGMMANTGTLLLRH